MNTTIKRDEMINNIMSNYFNTDDTKIYEANVLYLQNLNDFELERLYDSIEIDCNNNDLNII